MRDKRPVDELSIAELERILALRKREARQDRALRYAGRRVDAPPSPQVPIGVVPLPVALPEPPPTAAQSTRADSRNDIRADVRPGIRDEFLDDEPRFDDDPPGRPAAPPTGVSRARLWNRALTVIEIGAVLGLVSVLAMLFTSLQAVTQTTADIQQQYAATATAQYLAQYVAPTATPAVSFAAVVLPGGHVFDANNHTARFNLDEVPAQYRAAYENSLLNVTPAAQPTRSPEAPLSVRIPAINVSSSVITGDSWNDLQRGVGFHPGSANPGESGNMVLSAHDDVFGEIFKDLPLLKPGDAIIVTTQLHEYTYVVESTEIVAPSDVQVMDNSRRDRKQATLITCHPYRVDSQRYIVHAVLKAA